jgi:hypothetical protein
MQVLQRKVGNRKPDPHEEIFPRETLQQHSMPSGIYDSNYHFNNNDSSSSNTRIDESRSLLSHSKKKVWKSTFSSFLFRNRKSSYAVVIFVTGLFFFFHNNTLHAHEYYYYTSQHNQSSSVITVNEDLDGHSNTTDVFPSIASNKPALKDSTKIRDDNAVLVPPFNILPPPGSMCHSSANNATRRKLKSYCKKAKCMQHKKENLLQAMNQKGPHNNDGQGDKKSDAVGGCKMLWFASMHESEEECNSSITSSQRHRYIVDYSVALKSALRNARDTLQPVLILGRYGTSYENSTEPKKLGKWAEAKGVKVVYSPRLSFQEDVDQAFLRRGTTDFAHRQGPFLRLDIPKMIKEHGLLDLPNVCKSHVLYTDVDVIFANDITMRDIQLLLKSVGQGIASYGREYSKNAEIVNTGVMVINVKRLDEEMPKIIEHARTAEENYPGHDQEMLNFYREKNDHAYEEFSLLPMQYNWKAYWGLEPSTFSDLKIIHFHGPKLNRGLEEMSLCDVRAITSKSSSIPNDYQPHIQQGVCCDQGRTSRWIIDAIKNLRAPMKDLCDDMY